MNCDSRVAGPGSRLRSRAPQAIIPFLLLSVALAFSGCASQTTVSEGAPVRAVPVGVATAVEKAVPVDLRVIGNVEAFSTVSVKSQVEGVVERVHFKEGQDVKQGEELFTIDSRPFVTALHQAEANLARDVALAKNAQAQANRYTKLFEAGIVSQEQYDQFQTNAESYEAAVRADRAAVEKAKLDLSYCTIRSPIDGRTGSLIVHEGNLVKANADTAMVVINQISPIYVDFSAPEAYLPQIRKYQAQRELRVQAIIPNSDRPPEGLLSFVDNTVDTTTGTVKLKGQFDNRDRKLWPGQFVNVILRLTTRPNAVVVPSQAVQTGQSGQYVFVVKPDMTAESRPVIAGSTVGGESVIEEGLQPGENVVTDGQLRLVPGAKVEPKKVATSEE